MYRGIGAGWFLKTRNSAIPDTLTSVADPVELFEGMIKCDGNCLHDNDRAEMCVWKE